MDKQTAAQDKSQRIAHSTMKFGKLLKTRADDMGELGIGEHFLRYKALKKQLKEMQNMDPANGITSVFLPVWLAFLCLGYAAHL